MTMQAAKHEEILVDPWEAISTIDQQGSDLAELDDLKVGELRLLLSLLNNKVGAWVPLRQLLGNSLPTNSWSRSIKKLSEQNWISARHDPHDRRGKLVRLSVKGRHKLKSLKNPKQGDLKACWPETSLQHYLTGITALNVPSDQGTGDWHFFEIFQGSHGRSPGPFYVAGINMKGSSDLFGDEGIAEISDKLANSGIEAPYPVYAANHYRAMVDMLRNRLSAGKALDSYIADDWFPSHDDKVELRAFIDSLLITLPLDRKLKLEAWMGRNDIG